MKKQIEELREDYIRRLNTAERSIKEIHFNVEVIDRLNAKVAVYKSIIAELSRIINTEATPPAEVEER